MTGIGWLDAVSVVAFGAVTVLALIRLGRDRDRGLHGLLDDGFHAVMGIAMTAMFWPGSGGATAAWVAVVGLVVVWPLLVLALATRRPGEAATGRAGVRISLAHTGYWLTCALLMVVAVGAGHGSTSAASPEGAVTAAPSMTSMPGMPAHIRPTEAGIGASSLSNVFQAMAEWPVWPLVGLGFLIYAGLMLFSRRRPITERACAAVMAAGMATMALSL